MYKIENVEESPPTYESCVRQHQDQSSAECPHGENRTTDSTDQQCPEEEEQAMVDDDEQSRQFRQALQPAQPLPPIHSEYPRRSLQQMQYLQPFHPMEPMYPATQLPLFPLNVQSLQNHNNFLRHLQQPLFNFGNPSACRPEKSLLIRREEGKFGKIYYEICDSLNQVLYEGLCSPEMCSYGRNFSISFLRDISETYLVETAGNYKNAGTRTLVTKNSSGEVVAIMKSGAGATGGTVFDIQDKEETSLFILEYPSTYESLLYQIIPAVPTSLACKIRSQNQVIGSITQHLGCCSSVDGYKFTYTVPLDSQNLTLLIHSFFCLEDIILSSSEKKCHVVGAAVMVCSAFLITLILILKWSDVV